MQYFERSRLLRYATPTKHPGSVDVSGPGAGSLLEDMTEWLGEIPDWRLVRIGTAMVVWLIEKQSGATAKRPIEDSWTNYDPIQLDKLLLSATAVVEQARQMVDHLPEKELEAFSRAQSSYVYGGGDSAHLPMRRRLAFMVGMAIAQRDAFLIRCVRIYLSDPQEVSPFGEAILAFVSRLFLGNDNASQLNSIAEQIQECIRRLHSICNPYVGKPISDNSRLSAQLRSTLDQFKEILLLNTTVAADIVCGLWLYLDQDETTCLSILHPVVSCWILDRTVLLHVII